ncbi:SEC-C motif family domain protein [Burkholderia pseudomallei MSHR7500]|uniref:dsDNA nuclease domain-containing protein n=1 Tax=Burkholderia pseudomallei TaxID=28450 RepID=UPI000530C7B4|nr:dsDNA nuclease domain-containing protein [Burkholderia pseudomallei]KGS84558.1 SEC-C motif family domain protein [Burkholderia pseudomallei MSHR7500]
MTSQPIVLDSLQLKRIEAAHRGFLYQHLYAAGCLLLASGSGSSAVVVEADEDIEIALPDRHIYVQVKTRSEPLTEGDIDGTIQRFTQLRQEHVSGKRTGRASFVIVANVQPGPKLAGRIKRFIAENRGDLENDCVT